MEPDASLQHAQENTICPCPVHDQFSSRSPYFFLNITLILSFHLRLGLPNCFFILFPPPNPCMHRSPHPRSTCPVYPILLDFIARVILGKENQSLCSTTSSFLQSPVTSSLLGPATCHQTPLAYIPPSM